ncbi:4a-hydroxytetrahydrobiopterin dehydratase [Glutamicibacter sp. V16R2B1]|uniref:4a-hydroxytetrahydrobiopterin dehydratase n=1 Tax=Glutamicibacter sp. V16R2B1 TaxID=2036207 RepID=UPI0020171A1D|nr:4a-hydroxytetrahydrobiopterin dehydratase [Glutamicibacter sp. V16R2B1]
MVTVVGSIRREARTMSGKDVLSTDEIQARLSQLPHWRYGLGSLRTAFKCPSSAAAIQLVSAIGALAEEAGHHPDVDWRYDTVFVNLVSHDVGGVTSRDFTLATQISDQAENFGAQVDLGLVRTVEIAIDTENPQQISKIWQAALGYEQAADGALTDPHGRGPAIWFQETQTPNQNRFHVDVTVPHSHSGDLLETLKSTDAEFNYEYAPSWVIVTDKQGNRLCICTEAESGRE